jgi:cytochrome c1
MPKRPSRQKRQASQDLLPPLLQNREKGCHRNPTAERTFRTKHIWKAARRTAWWAGFFTGFSIVSHQRGTEWYLDVSAPISGFRRLWWQNDGASSVAALLQMCGC